MKLEGSLDAFSLPDIFQLLSYTKKTGGLRLQHADERGVVYFADGAVTGATAEGGRQALARRLVGLGLVDGPAIAAAVESAVESGASTSGGGVVAALISAGALTPDAVAPVAADHLHDAVFELLRWPNGEFAFAVDESNPDDVGLRLASEEVVTAASEQRARWGAAATVVPSPDAVPVLVGSSADETVVRGSDWAVLRLVDGRHRVADIVDLLGGVRLSTVVTLADLVERGLVRMQTADADDPVTDLQRRLDLLRPAEHAGPTLAPPAATEAAVSAVPTVPAVPVTPAEAVPAPVEPSAEESIAEELTPSVDAPTARTPIAAVPDPEVEQRPAEAPVPTAAQLREAERAASSTVVTVEDDDHDDEGTDAGPTATRPRLGGAHVPGNVVPPRDEPFLAPRQPDFAESPAPSLRTPPRPVPGSTDGTSAVAMAPAGDTLIERDPSVNRSLLLRLIAGVRGL